MLSQKNISKKAFTLVETLIVIGIMSLISIGVIQQLQKQAERQKASAAGQRISEAGRALQNYVEANKIALLNAIPAGTTRVADFCILNTFSPSDCNTTSGGAALPVDAVLPESFRNDSLFNTGYKIALKNVDNIDVIGLLYTDDSVYLNSSSEPRYDLLGAATKAAGSAVGFADKSGNVIKGLNGGWEINRADNLLPDSMNWANQITPGILAYRTGAEDRFDDTYLRRDGATELTGDLLLGNNNIKNINSISFDNYMVGQNGYLQNLRTQTIYNAGDIFSDTLNAQRTHTAELHTNKINTSASSNQDLLIGANGNNKDTASGNLYAGNLTTNQDITAKRNLTVNQDMLGKRDLTVNRNAVIGQDLTSNRDMLVKRNLTVNSNFHTKGKATIDGNLKSGSLNTGTITAGNINGSAIKGSSITSTGNISASGKIYGSTLRPTLNKTEGSSCSGYSVGEMAKTSAGLILSCQGGKWKSAQGGAAASWQSTKYVGSRTVDLGKHSFCAMNYYRSDESKAGTCYVYKSGSNWKLQITGHDRYIQCGASCF